MSFVHRRFSAQALELHLSEQRYRQIVESVQVVLWRSAVDIAEFRYVNRQAEQVLGYPSASWTGTRAFWVDRLHPEDRELVQSYCTAAAEYQGPQQFEHRMIASDGRVVSFLGEIERLYGQLKQGDSRMSAANWK